MTIHRTLHRFAAAAALATALGAASVSGAFAQGAADRPGPAGQVVKAGRQLDDGDWHGDGLSLDAAENRKVDDFLAHAQQAEQSISPEMRAVAQVSHATLIGFDQRLKSADSLKRKVATSLKATPGQTVDGALAKINDSIRYTLEWPDGRYVKGVAAASSMLSSWGNDSVKWSNTWGAGKGYKAINSAWRDLGSGHVFEVQFHTPSSKWAQEVTHKLYEEQRLPSTPAERAKELQEQQDAIFASVPVPEGAERLAAPATRRPVGGPQTLPAAA
ncbi:ATP nucleotide 3'-pyrophosphokinase [Streptomyces sp. NPDC001667]